MKFSLKRGDKVVKTFDTNKEVEFLSKEGSSNNNTSIHPVRLIKKTVILKKEPTIKSQEKTGNRVIKHIGTPITQQKKEDVKVITKTINVGSNIKENNEPIIRKVHLRKIKKIIDTTTLPAIPRRTKIVTTKKVNNKNNKKYEIPTANIVKRVINVSVGKREETNPINTSKKEDIGFNVNLVKIKKPITVSTSVVKRLSRGSVIKNEKKSETKDDIKKEVKILNIGMVTEEKPTTLEEEKTEIINNSGVEDVSKEIVETYNTAAESVEEIPTEVIIDTNNTNPVEVSEDTTSIEDTKSSDGTFYDVHFVATLPEDVSKYASDDYTLFALYIGHDDFEEHTEKMKYPVYVDTDKYNLYALYDGEFYLTDGYDENGTMILLINNEEDDYYEEENEEISTDNVNNMSNNDITEDDIVDELKKSGKPSIEDLL